MSSYHNPGIQSESAYAPLNAGYSGAYNQQSLHQQGSSRVQTPTYRSIMNEEFCGCFNDCSACLLVSFFAPCVSGNNQSILATTSCLIACICYPCCAGCYRSNVQNAMGVLDGGCMRNSTSHWCCPLCALVQETRAIKSWYYAGRPTPAPGAMAM